MPSGKYVHIPAKNPDMLRLGKAELEALGTKPAREELARRAKNKAAKRAAKKGGSS